VNALRVANQTQKLIQWIGVLYVLDRDGNLARSDLRYVERVESGDRPLSESVGRGRLTKEGRAGSINTTDVS
jgi:hypothetical protein